MRRVWERSDIDIKRDRVGLRTKRPPVASPIEHPHLENHVSGHNHTWDIYAHDWYKCVSSGRSVSRLRVEPWNYSPIPGILLQLPYRPPPPSMSLYRPFAILSHAEIVIVVWPLYIITMTFHVLKNLDPTASHFFADENCESSKFIFTSFPFILESEISELLVFLYYITRIILSQTDKPRIQIVETNSEITSWFRNAIINRRCIPFANFCPGETAIVNVHGIQRYCYFLRGNALVDSDRLLAIWSTSWNLSAHKMFLFNITCLNIFATL